MRHQKTVSIGDPDDNEQCSNLLYSLTVKDTGPVAFTITPGNQASPGLLQYLDRIFYILNHSMRDGKV